MQPNKLSPIAGLLLATLLGACGGKGGDEPEPSAPPPPPALKASPALLSTDTPRAIAQNALKFDGGECSGGTAPVTASWDFGDGTPKGSSNTHTYTEAHAQAKMVSSTNKSTIVTVTCTDAVGVTKSSTVNITVESASVNGFLGKTWTSYAAIDPTRPSLYPVAGVADSGDIYGIALPSVASTTHTKATAGTTSFSSTNWTAPTDDLATGTDTSLFNDTGPGVRTTAIDLAVSPNGHAIAAWMAQSTTGVPSIWYTTKSSLSAAWTLPVQVNVPVMEESIKVAISDAGVGAIAYCTSSGGADTVTRTLSLTSTIKSSTAQLITTSNTTPTTISNNCGVTDSGYAILQRHRLFDIAIDNASSTIYAVGVSNGTTDPAKSVVTLKSFTSGGGLTATTPISDEIASAFAPVSLSYARSPNGNYAAVAWNQVRDDAYQKSNILTRIQVNGAWGTAIQEVQNNYTTKDYARPLLAINDNGDVFLAMHLKYANGGDPDMEVSNYDAAAAAPVWSAPRRATNKSTPNETQFNMTDIAIDKWGTGLVTRLDTNGSFTQAGTLSKAGTWSDFTNISTQYPSLRLHNQTMRALPDGRTILVTSIYDDVTPLTANSKPVASGYMLLK
ncbi:MAG: PKD domain-containing protein [Burkholderiales bacterium]|nr:PKD domain-containing protein [Burkholderiales bacterium]